MIVSSHSDNQIILTGIILMRIILIRIINRFNQRGCPTAQLGIPTSIHSEIHHNAAHNAKFGRDLFAQPGIVASNFREIPPE